jgi:hypothetical protein
MSDRMTAGKITIMFRRPLVSTLRISGGVEVMIAEPIKYAAAVATTNPTTSMIPSTSGLLIIERTLMRLPLDAAALSWESRRLFVIIHIL